MSFFWFVPLIVAAATLPGFVAFRRGRPRVEDDPAVFSITAVPRDQLDGFRLRRPHLLTLRECLRWLSLRGFDRYRGRLMAEARLKQRTDPGVTLLVHFAVVTKYGYVSSGEEWVA